MLANIRMYAKVQRAGCPVKRAHYREKKMNSNLSLTEPSAVIAPHRKTTKEVNALSSLIRIKIVFILPMLIISAGGYLALMTLAGFSKETLSAKVVGSLNVGFLLIFCDYALILILAVFYTRMARSFFDPIADQLNFGGGEKL
jgi:uncharacterized membrane protein (DUF485 family)